MSNKPMRALMPEAAAIVDAFRAAGLTDNGAICDGMRTGSFYASEGGREIGKRDAMGQGVTPVLSLEAETRLADLWWKRSVTQKQTGLEMDCEVRNGRSR